MRKLNFALVALRGVQHLITTGRTLADVWAGSQIVSRLSAEAVAWMAANGWRVISPVLGKGLEGATNRIWAVEAAPGSGQTLDALKDHLSTAMPAIVGSDVQPQGFPQLIWVTVSADDAAEAWRLAMASLVARKRVADFAGYLNAEGEARPVCSMCGEREADPNATAGPLTDDSGEVLCVLCGIRRRYRTQERVGAFPSTSTIASLSFRLHVIERAGSDPDVASAAQRFASAADVLALSLDPATGRQTVFESAIPALAAVAENSPQLRSFAGLEGSWLYVDTIEEAVLAVDRGGQVAEPSEATVEALSDFSRARRGLFDRLGADRPRLSPYLCLVLQDVDHMGRGLGSERWVNLDNGADDDFLSYQGHVSEAVISLARDAAEIVEQQHRGRVLYAGGDDMSAFLPVGEALGAARKLRSVVDRHLPGLTASTAIVWFHRSNPLRHAMRVAHEALKEAKSGHPKLPGRDRLAVVVLRRGGERARAVLRWGNGEAARHLEMLATAFGGPLSPSLVGDLSVLVPPPGASDEMDRNVWRSVATHLTSRGGGDHAVQQAVIDLASLTWGASDRRHWVDGIQTAVFVSQESG